MSIFELAYSYGVKLAAPLQLQNFSVRITQGIPYHAVHYMPDGYAIYDLAYEHLSQDPSSPYHPDNLVKSLQKVPARTWEWSSSKQASVLDGWANHAAMNVGLAVSDSKNFAKDLFYAAIPPKLTGHSDSDGKEMQRGSVKDWFMYGYDEAAPNPGKTASVRIVSKILPMISRSP